MRKIQKYFYSGFNYDLFDKQKVDAFVIISILGITLTVFQGIYLIIYLQIQNNSFSVFLSSVIALASSFGGLVILKYRGIKMAGNFLSFMLVLSVVITIQNI